MIKKFIFIVLVCLVVFSACGHETKKELVKLEKDKSIADGQALEKMAASAWMHSSGDSEKFTAMKKQNGKYLINGYVLDKFSMTSLKQDTFIKVNMLTDAKYAWRLFRSGVKRGLDELVFTRIVTLSSGSRLELYRVRLALDQMKQIKGWDTSDPYSVGDYDLLDTREALDVEKRIPAVWTVELNNSSSLTVR